MRDIAEIAQAVPVRADRSRWLKSAIGIAVTVVLLGLMASRVDAAKTWSAIASLPAPALAVAFVLLVFDFAAKIARWRLMLQGATPGVTWAASAKTLLASIALNNVLPLRAGDVARAVAFRTELKAPTEARVAILLLERLLDTAMLLMLAVGVMIPLQQSGIMPPAFSAVPVLAAAVVALMVAVMATSGPLARAALRNEPAIARWLPGFARTPLIAGLGALAAQLQGWRSLSLIAFTVIAWLCEALMFAMLAAGLNLPHPLVAGLLACALATLSGLVPSAPGAFGTFHVSAMAAASVTGAGSSDAAAFAVVAHALMWVPLTAIGLAALALLSARPTVSKIEDLA